MLIAAHWREYNPQKTACVMDTGRDGFGSDGFCVFSERQLQRLSC
jgi:hypothetical protein